MKKRFHTDKRTNENFTREGLETLTGQNRSKWVRYVTKELIDNALEASTAPDVTVQVEGEDLIVKDNGPGIPEEQVNKIFQDVDRYGGTKRHYKLPTRGAQGNALMTVLGIQTLLERPLVIRSNGTEYSIEAVQNANKRGYEVTVSTRPVQNHRGFSVRIQGIIGSGMGDKKQVKRTVEKFAVLNPQSRFWYEEEGDTIFENQRTFEVNRLTPSSKKTTTGKVIWFGVLDFQERLLADYRINPEMPVNEFVEEFYGLASKGYDIRNGQKTIGDFVGERTLKGDQVADLYARMARETKPFNERNLHKTLGSIGEDALRERLFWRLKTDAEYETIEEVAEKIGRDDENITGPEDLTLYYRGSGIESTESKVCPFVFECMAIPTEWRKDDGLIGGRYTEDRVLFGLNQSFTYSNPRIRVTVDENPSTLQNVFGHLDYPFSVVYHLTAPNLDFTDKGKQSFNFDPYQEEIEAVVQRTIKKFERDFRPALNRLNKSSQMNRELYGKAPKGFIKDFIFSCFEETYREATDDGTYNITQRQFYYAVRPKFLQEAERCGYKYSCRATVDNPKELELNYGTFQRHVDTYEREVLGERVIWKNDRGFFTEPHTNKRVNLGTKAVGEYTPDPEQFGNLLFVEKTGFYELLHNDFQLDQRYDLGLVNAKGFSNNAARDLIETIQQKNPDVTLYTLTDLDIKGLGIASNAKKPDELSAVDLFDTERLGVTVDDVETYDLPVESAHYSDPEVTELQNRYKDGTISERQYTFLKNDNRVEINAFTPVELREYLLTKLDEAGIEKIKPTDKTDVETPDVETLQEAKKRVIRKAVGEWILNQVGEDLRDSIEKTVTIDSDQYAEMTETADADELYEKIMEALEDHPPKHWQDINRELKDEIEEEAKTEMEEFENDVTETVNKALESYKVSVARTR